MKEKISTADASARVVPITMYLFLRTMRRAWRNDRSSLSNPPLGAELSGKSELGISDLSKVGDIVPLLVHASDGMLIAVASPEIIEQRTHLRKPQSIPAMKENTRRSRSTCHSVEKHNAVAHV